MEQKVDGSRERMYVYRTVCVCIAGVAKVLSRFRSQNEGQGGFISCEPRAHGGSCTNEDRAIASVWDYIVTGALDLEHTAQLTEAVPRKRWGGRACRRS